jgi:hypothetical protein
MTSASLSLVMPISAAYPALIVPVSLVTGALPGVLEWLGAVTGGVVREVLCRTGKAVQAGQRLLVLKQEN